MDCNFNIEKLLLQINASSKILLIQYHHLQKYESIYTVALTSIFVHFLFLPDIISTVVFPSLYRMETAQRMNQEYIWKEVPLGRSSASLVQINTLLLFSIIFTMPDSNSRN